MFGTAGIFSDKPAQSSSNDEIVPDWTKNEVLTGTTIFAAEFADGVVLGADTRTSSGTFIVDRTADKITQVTDRIYCCRSGSAADTQAITGIVKYQLDFVQMDHEREPTVAMTAHLFRDLCYRYRDQLMAGIIVAGWDEFEGGQVYSVNLGGSLLRQSITIGGSGSAFIYGYVDKNYRKGMTKQECLAFVRNGVELAINRDGSSGGCVRLVCITKDGVERDVVLAPDVAKFHEF